MNAGALNSLKTIPYREQGLYFLHIPKTAGTSLRYWLQDLFRSDAWLPCHVMEEVRRLNLETVRKAPLISGHFGWRILDLLDKPRPTITFLRHPIKRVISNYLFNLNCFDELVEIARSNGREDWVEYYQAASKLKLPELMRNELYHGYLDNLQTRYLSGIFPSEECVYVDERVLNQAKTKLAELDFFGICEWMSASIDLLSFQLAIPDRPLDMQFNSSQEAGKKSKLYLSNSDLEAIARSERYDFELYEYARGLFLSRMVAFWRELRQDSAGRFCPPFPLDEHPANAIENMVHYNGKRPADDIKRLLDARFQAQEATPNVPPSSPQTGRIDFRELTFGSGWHPPFIDSFQRCLRWAGPRESSRLFLPLAAGHNYLVNFTIRILSNYRFIESLKIKVSGQSVPVQFDVLPLEPGVPRMVAVEFRIPRELVRAFGPWTEIEFEVTGPMIATDSQPPILVSFAIDGLEFQTIEPHVAAPHFAYLPLANSANEAVSSS